MSLLLVCNASEWHRTFTWWANGMPAGSIFLEESSNHIPCCPRDVVAVVEQIPWGIDAEWLPMDVRWGTKGCRFSVQDGDSASFTYSSPVILLTSRESFSMANWWRCSYRYYNILFHNLSRKTKSMSTNEGVTKTFSQHSSHENFVNFLC